MKRVFPAILKIAVSVAGLAAIYFLFRGQIPEVVKVFKAFHPVPFCMAVLVLLAAFMIVSLRLQCILEGQKVFIPWKTLFYFNFIGHFFSLFLPSAVGGDVVKAFYINKKCGDKITSFTAVFLDRLAGSVGFMGMAFVAFLFFWGKEDLVPVRNSVSLIFCCMLFGFVLLLSRRFAILFKKMSFLIPTRKLRGFILHLYGEMKEYREDKRILLKALAISVVMQIVYIHLYYFLSLSLRLPVPYFTYYFVVPIVTTLSMAPSINGLGVREAGIVYFLSAFTSKESALAVSLLYAAVIYSVGFAFGIFYLIREGFSYRILKEAAIMKEETEKIEAGQESIL